MSTDPSRPKRVLIVEDNPDNRALASKVLRRAGFDTVECDRAEGLIDLLVATRPDVVLMDIELPGQSGYDAVQQVRSHAATAPIPVIALTAYAMQEDRQRCLRVGFNDYLSKPLDIHLLVQMVRRHAAAVVVSPRV
jgi:two-component system cell cycle response regulator DivK